MAGAHSTAAAPSDPLGRDELLQEYGFAFPAGNGASATEAELSTEPLENLVELAAKLCGVPFGVINVLTSDEQRQVAAVGIDAGVCSREDSMCSKVFHSGEMTVVRDASLDPRFATNPFVTGEIAAVRFYASVPLEMSSGFVLGSLCVFSDSPAAPDAGQLDMLEILSRQAVQLLELQRRTLQLNRALTEVRESNAKLAEFAGRVSHDLRGPLTTTLGYVEMAEDEVEGDHPAAEYLQIISASGHRMLAMLEDVLTYSRMGGVLQRQRVSLQEVAAEVARDLGLSFGPGAVLDSEEMKLDVDPGQLRTLLQNLVANAMNYRSPERDLNVRISGISNYHGITVLVADNGKGIAQADRQRVLEPLVRLHRQGDGHGSGLGLAICRRIAEAHGGELSLKESPGGGTTAVISFPTDQ
ncbi:GAF domain-containing sensor histidine kinase [Pseudarthrobacter niigatensis]|uniref:Sensor-like histidine kinase SenX3 n=1 Tax=Pseudarthrobacter niigatensis TaxID=369935 RepID=A0AAJ1SRK4_9MICC|nr:GAF domain-containing sensor histidine kinase [Pseudarthrobacter niigatensis]MDQ0145456.1 signal transduction histidine kinase [Pseudarthrobacter niigatensis]MDQ0265770.1 signal transduction histidine kinase [Pseudarthrobacter niigatensis]